MPGTMYYCLICGYSNMSEDLVTRCEANHRTEKDLIVESVTHKKLEGTAFPMTITIKDKRTGALQQYHK